MDFIANMNERNRYSLSDWVVYNINEPPNDKTNKMSAPSEDTDQLGHPPSLNRVFAVRWMGS